MEMLLFLVFLLICSFVVVEFLEKKIWLVWVLWWWNLRGWDGEGGGFFLRVYVGGRW